MVRLIFPVSLCVVISFSVRVRYVGLAKTVYCLWSRDIAMGVAEAKVTLRRWSKAQCGCPTCNCQSDCACFFLLQLFAPFSIRNSSLFPGRGPVSQWLMTGDSNLLEVSTPGEYCFIWICQRRDQLSGGKLYFNRGKQEILRLSVYHTWQDFLCNKNLETPLSLQQEQISPNQLDLRTWKMLKAMHSSIENVVTDWYPWSPCQP